jgi:hypothetical protein
MAADPQAPEPAPADAGPAAPVVTPFWKRVPALLSFPLQPACASWVLVAALVTGAARAWAVPAFPAQGAAAVALGLFAWLGAALVLARFVALVVERSASGFLSPRMWPRELGGGSWSRAMRMLAVVVLVPLAAAWLLSFLLPRALAILFVAAALPAAVIAIAQTDSLRAALHPRRVAQTVRLLGPRYALLGIAPALSLPCAHAWLLSCLPELSAPPPGAAAPSHLLAGAVAAGWGLAAGYLLLLVAALTGYAMLQYSAALGVAVTGPGEVREGRADAAARYARRSREALIQRLVADGDARAAIDLVNEELSLRPRDISLHMRLRALLLQEGSQVRIEAHATRFLEILLAAGNSGNALELAQQMRREQPGFDVPDPGQRIALARAALEHGDTALAAEMVHGFDKRFRGHPLSADAFLVGARLLLLWGREPQAREMFAYVVRTAPPGPCAEEAKRYLARFA